MGGELGSTWGQGHCCRHPISRQRLDGQEELLAEQVHLLRQIVRCQAEDLSEYEREHSQAQPRPPLAARAGTPQSASTPTLARGQPRGSAGSHAAELRAAAAEVERLHAELALWRSADDRWSLDLGPAAVGPALGSCERPLGVDERSLLDQELAQVRDRIDELSSPAPFRRPELAAAAADVAVLRSAVAAERRSLVLAAEQLSLARRALEEDRAAHAAAADALASEEAALLDRQVEAEADLSRAQAVQLLGVQDALVALGPQLRRAREEGAELRASLEQNQAALRRLVQ
ncbi:unnamed protein product [Prorocentrum cordatum]|uniref:Uncharacterized protein n=1 Tax=Prorocentrum cordatum TaxID=2364126 RepID=A0ABN9QXY9_9DINO|nr:unnamed protein product [Polarella glacialis]